MPRRAPPRGPERTGRRARRPGSSDRRLAWLVLLLMGLCHHAVAAGEGGGQGEHWDIKDTHQRLDRIYKKLGIREPEQEKQDGGCNGARREERQPQRQARRVSAPPPTMPPWLGYLLIALVVLAMVIPLALVLRQSFRDAPRDRSPLEEEDEEADDTVVEVRGPWVVDLSQCRQLVREGRLAEAFASLHRLTLLGLERMHQLTLDESTTNWEYVRKISSKPELRQVLSEVTLAAERSVLGRRPPGAEEYQGLERLVLQHVRGGVS